MFYFLQILQAADKNYDTSGKKQVWKCESSRLDQPLKCTLHLFCTYILYIYAVHVYSDFIFSLFPLLLFRSSTTVKEYGEYQNDVLRNHPKPKYDTLPRKMLKFGTNCDLSDYDKLVHTHTHKFKQCSNIDLMPPSPPPGKFDQVLGIH